MTSAQPTWATRRHTAQHWESNSKKSRVLHMKKIYPLALAVVLVITASYNPIPPGTPEEDRFTKTPLAMGEFFEPTEMTILPNLDILVAQRRGEIMRYNHLTKKVKQAGFLNVYFKTQHTPKVNAEEGVLGIQADPNFAANHYVYIYYSPADTSVNRLSRFTFVNNHIDNKSEKIIL